MGKHFAIAAGLTAGSALLLSAIIAIRNRPPPYVYAHHVLQANADLAILRQVLNRYAANHNSAYPEQLGVLMRDSLEGRELFDKQGHLGPDPWRNPYIYQTTSQRTQFTLLSYGSDGVPGGGGDAQDIIVGP